MTIISALAIALCPAPPSERFTCVHDGDTFWLEGEKIRIADIDTPELNGRCERERRVARAARERLVVLINERGMRLERVGTDRYGRTLARIGTISDVLIAEGLARQWGDRRGWCG
ncbi:thermonuclease family protein [Erythrobacter rubeus]|uniref:Thermonuclease family protein n=1 Tax=Erythrobacter rubeus TaxID=2760803 RepID=A0ABR8KPY1_9SPHN|nr:thermonuclease family protein [Erythrobacter rubeus]MBD2842725.1 thermonuclease family protein [Erythrobacter rubeus]